MTAPTPQMLSAEELEELEGKLRAMAAELQQRLDAQPSGRSGEISALAALTVGAGRPEGGVAERRRLWIELGKLRAALDAIGLGRYGVCRRCAGPIGYARLKTRPNADVCVGCLTDPGK